VSAVLAYYLHNLNPNVLPFLPIKWYGVAYVLGFIAAFLLMRWLARKEIGQFKPDEVGDFITLTALCGVLLGGRLGYMLFYNLEEFIHAPWTLFNIRGGGMSSHGGILAVMGFTYFYARKKGYNWAGVGDNLVSVAPVGLFFGRLANYVNGELYGKPANVRWAVQFPNEMERPEIRGPILQQLGMTEPPNAPGAAIPEIKAAISTHPEVREVLERLLTPRHPSQIYEALLEGVLLFAILFALRVKFKNMPYGLLTGLFFTLYAVVRIFGEIFREPDYPVELIMGIQKGQFYSLFMIAVGIGFMVYAVKKGRVTAA